MTFVQPKELNRFLYSPDSWSAAQVWLLVKMSTPMLILCFLSLAEVRFLQGLPLLPGLMELSLGMMLLILLLWGMSRLEMRYQRTFDLRDDRIETGLFDRRRIRWKDVICFIVEPAGRLDELKKVTVRARRQQRSSRWSLLFADKEQYQTLLAELKRRLMSGGEKYTIEILHSPIRYTKAPSVKVAGIWLYCVAVLLFVNGLPMLLGGLGVFDSQGAERVRPVNPLIVAWASHFHGYHERRHFFLVTGTALMAAGAACLGVSLWLDRREKGRPTFEIGDERILPPTLTAEEVNAIPT